MTVLSSKHYSGHHKAAEEEDDPGTLGEGNVEDRLQVQLEEDGGGGSRQSWMESSGLWPVFQWERQGISQVRQVVFMSWRQTEGQRDKNESP